MGIGSRSVSLAALALATGCYESHYVGECREAQPAPVDVAPESGALVVEAIAPEEALPNGSEPAGMPHVAWDGASWNVAWGDRFAVLDGAGRLRAPIEARHEGGDTTALEAGTCRRGITAAGTGPGESVVAWIGGDGVVEEAALVPGIDADVARGVDRWWIASDASSAAAGARIAVLEARDGATTVPRARAWIVDEAIASPRVVAAAGGAVVSWVDREGIVQQVVGSERAGAAWRVTTANVWARGAMDAAVLRTREGRERVVVAATDGAMVHVALSDPARREVVAGPLAIARTTALRTRPGIAPMPERGALAVCVPSGPGPWGGEDVIDRVSLVVLGEDAARLTPVIEVARGGRVRAVACGWSGRELLVAWWRSEGGRDEIAIRRMRVRAGGAPLPISEPW